MDIRASNKTSQAHHAPRSRYRPACAVLLLMSLTIRPGIAAPADDVRATFDHLLPPKTLMTSRRWNRRC